MPRFRHRSCASTSLRDRAACASGFTARPGLIEQLERDVDRWLGQEFLEAESRLEADLIDGREFIAFSKLQRLRYHSPHVPGSGRAPVTVS